MMRGARRFVRSLLWGGSGGLAGLALDQLSAFLTLGFAIRLKLEFVLAYLVAGAVAAALTEAVVLVARRRPPNGLRIFSTALAVLYAASIFERVEQALSQRWGTIAAATAAALALAGWALWAWVLAKIAARSGPRPDPGGDAVACGLILASAAAALGLAVNRNLVTHPVEPAALAADAGVLGLGLALACGVRLAGAARTAAAAAVLATAAVVVAELEPQPPSPESDARPSHPHLVLLVVDTLRQDVFRAVVEETAEGRRFRQALGGAAWFDRAVAAAPWTAPSVASIMTGLYPPEHGFRVGSRDKGRSMTRLSDSVATLAESLGGKGYRTLAIVANPILHPASGISRGFQRFELLPGSTAKMPLLTVLAKIGVLEKDYYQDAAAVRRRFADLLAGEPAGRPLFLWLHLMDPHAPLHPHHDLSPDPRGEELEDDERLYREETRYALREATRIIDHLGSAGLWPHTVFVLVSDHGEMFASDGHGRLPPRHPRNDGHGHALYDELVRVPLVIRPPGGLSEPRRIGVLASHVDLHGTFFDLLGLDPPRLAGDRVSLAPWLTSEPPAEAPLARAFALIGGIKDGPPQEGVRTETHKLIRHVEGGLPDELFDLGADPGEQRNLAGIDVAAETELDELLTLTWSQLRQVTDTGTVGYDEETRRRLEALGYL